MTTKITASVIEAGAISTASLADTSITAAKLAGTLDLTGKTVTVATATAGDNDTTVASTAFVSTAIANLADSAPSTLDTLNELAAALGDDANFSTTVTNSIALKAPLASPDFTGDVTFDTSTLVVDSTNNRVGIGTTSPGAALEVLGNIILRQSASNSETVYITTNARGGGTADADLRLGNSVNGDILTIHNTNVGIGTTSPAAMLNVYTDAGRDFRVDHGTANRTILSTDRGMIVKAGGGYSLELNTGSDGGSILFQDNGVTHSQFNASGNLALGTTTHFATGGAAKLSVAGILSIGASNADLSYIRRQSAGNYAWQTYDNNNTGSIQLQPYGGNVGIGTASPTQKLDVNGTVELNNLTIAGSQGSDGQVLTSTGSGIAWEDAAGGVDGIVSSADATAITIGSDENVTFAQNISSVNNLYVADDIGHAGDSDTYMSFENDYLGFYTGGVNTLVLSGGQVGVGGSPAAKFSVDVGAPGSTDQTLGLFQSQDGRRIGFVWDDSTSTLGVATLTNHALTFHTNGNSSERMRLTSDGVAMGDTDGDYTHRGATGGLHVKRGGILMNGPPGDANMSSAAADNCWTYHGQGGRGGNFTSLTISVPNPNNGASGVGYGGFSLEFYIAGYNAKYHSGHFSGYVNGGITLSKRAFWDSSGSGTLSSGSVGVQGFYLTIGFPSMTHPTCKFVINKGGHGVSGPYTNMSGVSIVWA